MIARFISLMTVAFADNEGLHHLNEAAAISLLQTSSSMKITQDPATFGAKGGGGAKGFGAKGVPKVPSPGPPSGGGGGGGSCKAAKDALKTARQAAGTACEGEPTDYVAPPEGMTAVDQYKIFPPPEEDDLSSLKSCKEGWMAHTTQQFINGNQCWGGAVVGAEHTDVTGPLGTYKVTRSESNHVTPSACLELVWKISRQTGLCNPNVTNRRHNLPANYRFTGCAAEFWDQTSSDVLTVPEHIQEETQLNNYRGQSKFGSCMLCGRGLLGDGNRVYGQTNKGDDYIGMGKAGILRRDSHAPIVRMTCILNPEEKDGFELYHATDY